MVVLGPPRLRLDVRSVQRIGNSGWQDDVLKVGKKGVLTLRTDTKVGSVVLEPGRYRFQHRTEGLDHFVRFTRLKDATPYDPFPTRTRGEVEDASCRLEPLNAKARRTAITTAGGNITRIVVRGENVAHLF
jgi:hypothetical protein